MTNTSYVGGATDKSVVVRAITISTGLAKTDLAYNTATIVGSYWRAGANAAVSLTLATQTVNGAHSDGGLVHIANGVYRVDLPDAAIAAGADFVTGAFSGVADCLISGWHIDILGVDPRSATAPDVNLTKILGTAVATPATAGLLDVNVKQISTDATAADNAEAFFDGTGYAGTNNTIPLVTVVTTVNGLAANTITAAATASDFGAEIADAVWDEALSGHVAAGSTGEAVGDGYAVAVAIEGTINETVVTGGTIGSTGNDTTHLHLTGLPFGDDELNDYLIVVTDVSASEKHARWISDYVNSTALATLATALPFTPQNATDTYSVLAVRRDVAVASVAANALTASALATDAVTEIASAVVEAEITALLTYNRSANATATITGPTSGSNSLGISTDAAYEPIKTL